MQRRPGAEIDVGALEGADAVVHLAGAGIADGRWTAERKRLLVSSRVDFTRALVAALGALKQRPSVLVSGSAIGIYGDRGDEVLTESSAPGTGFLAELCVAWEAEAIKAEALGIRVVRARTGVVLSPNGGALAKMLLPFKAGAGGPIAGGRQWMSWIGIDDAVGGLVHAVCAANVKGPLNLVAPNPVTNGEFVRTLGAVLSRPAIVPLPAFAVRLAFGEMGEATLLPSQRVVSAGLEQAGFSHAQPVLEPALRQLLGRRVH